MKNRFESSGMMSQQEPTEWAPSLIVRAVIGAVLGVLVWLAIASCGVSLYWSLIAVPVCIVLALTLGKYFHKFVTFVLELLSIGP